MGMWISGGLHKCYKPTMVCTNVKCVVWVRIDKGFLRNLHRQEQVTTRFIISSRNINKIV